MKENIANDNQHRRPSKFGKRLEIVSVNWHKRDNAAKYLIWMELNVRYIKSKRFSCLVLVKYIKWNELLTVKKYMSR